VFEKRGWLGKHHTPDSCHSHLTYRSKVLKEKR